MMIPIRDVLYQHLKGGIISLQGVPRVMASGSSWRWELCCWLRLDVCRLLRSSVWQLEFYIQRFWTLKPDYLADSFPLILVRRAKVMIQTRWDRRFQKGERSGSGVFPECVAKGSRLTLEVWRLESCSLSVVGAFFFPEASWEVERKVQIIYNIDIHTSNCKCVWWWKRLINDLCSDTHTHTHSHTHSHLMLEGGSKVIFCWRAAQTTMV